MSVLADTELLTTGEVARLLKVRPRTVRRWMIAGILPATRIGARWLVPSDALTERLDPCAAPRHFQHAAPRTPATGGPDY